MKKTVSAVLIVLVLAGMITTVASAQFTKNTSFQVQSLSSTQANVHIVFYDEYGDAVGGATVDDTSNEMNNTNMRMKNSLILR